MTCSVNTVLHSALTSRAKLTHQNPTGRAALRIKSYLIQYRNQPRVDQIPKCKTQNYQKKTGNVLEWRVISGQESKSTNWESEVAGDWKPSVQQRKQSTGAKRKLVERSKDFPFVQKRLLSWVCEKLKNNSQTIPLTVGKWTDPSQEIQMTNKYMKKYPVLLVIRKRPISDILKYYLTQAEGQWKN